MDSDCQICRNTLISNKASSEHEITLVDIKDAIIGSNRQKGAIISQGLVPTILDICCDNEADWQDRVNAFVILGSLAKGSEEHVKVLAKEYNTTQILIKQMLLQNNDKKIIELCLSTLRSIFEHPFITVNVFFSDTRSLSYLLSLSSPENSIQCQVSVACILYSLCQSFNDQMLLFQAGTIPVLARMICSNYEELQLPALRSLACMCFENRTISDNVCVTSFKGKSLSDILTYMMSRLFNPEIQLTAARCLTYVYRSGTLPSTDHRLVYKALPCLARLCTDDYSQMIRASAAETLAYFIEIDSELQRIAAISNHLIKHLSQLLQFDLPQLKQASFRCFASLAANDEVIRKRIIETKGFVETLMESLNDADPQVKLASIRCLHSLSRSVQQLRTTFQDYSVWKILMGLVSNQPPKELLIVVTSTLCNMLLEFSPSKDPMLNLGIMEMLCSLTENSDASLRLNGVWAIMNMAFQADQHVKSKIINMLGGERILKLLCDTDSRIVMKTLGLLRNLLSRSVHIDCIMSAHYVELMKAVNMVLGSGHSPEIKEQALCVIGNIAAGAQKRDYILEDDCTMMRLTEFLRQQDSKLQAAALFAIYNIIGHGRGPWSQERYKRLQDLQIIQGVMELDKKTSVGLSPGEDYIFRTTREIISQCKLFFEDE